MRSSASTQTEECVSPFGFVKQTRSPSSEQAMKGTMSTRKDPSRLATAEGTACAGSRTMVRSSAGLNKTAEWNSQSWLRWDKGTNVPRTYCGTGVFSRMEGCGVLTVWTLSGQLESTHFILPEERTGVQPGRIRAPFSRNSQFAALGFEMRLSS